MSASIVVYGDDLSGGVEKQPSGTPGAPLSVSVVDGVIPSGESSYAQLTLSATEGGGYFFVPVGADILVHEMSVWLQKMDGSVVTDAILIDSSPEIGRIVVGSDIYESGQVVSQVGYGVGSEAGVLKYYFSGGRFPVGVRVNGYNQAVAGNRVGIENTNSDYAYMLGMRYSVIS